MRTSISLLLLASGVTLAQDPGTGTSPTNDSSAPAAVDEAYFPREAISAAGKVLVHAPQIESWADFEAIVGRSAVEVTPTGAEHSTLGSVRFRALVEPDLEERIVRVSNPEVLDMAFQSGHSETLAGLVRAVVKTHRQVFPLDLVLAGLPREMAVTVDEGLRRDPPVIFTSQTPAVLVILNGEPVLAPIESTKLEFAINTNWDLLRHKEKDWYLLNDTQWLRAAALDAEWMAVRSLPRDFKKLPDNENWAAVRAQVPPSSADQPAPRLFVSQEPAELILVDGASQLEAIPDTALRYVTNTESDLFMYEGAYYYLVSGRWFGAPRIEGEWKAVQNLPGDFARIPEDHAKAHVRVSVPGTKEAWLAVLEAQIPRKATIRRDAGEDLAVTYAGDEPQFEPIEGTRLERAVNTSFQVIRFGDEYYLCHNAVWFLSAGATGPWEVADMIPAEIYQIPPSSPMFNATHVKVYDSYEDTVEVGYTSGYEGSNVTTSYTVVYGTGWYYAPWYWYYHGYPAYYWYPTSYGYGARYNPNTGVYSRGRVVYGPYGGAGSVAKYNPETGAYARGNAVWDSNEIAMSGYGYSPRSDTAFATNRYYNEDSNYGWGESVVQRGDQWVYTEYEREGDTVRREFETSGGATGEMQRERQGDQIESSGTITRDGESVDFESTITREDGQLTKEGTVTRDGQSVDFESTTQRTDQGVRRDVETSEGGTGSIGRSDGSRYGYAQSAEGDLYVGKDGEVYKRTDDGWQKRGDSGNWESTERQQRSGDGSQRSTGQQRAGTASDSLSVSGSRNQYGSSSQGRSYSSNRDIQQNLNRDYGARQYGYDRYNSHQRQRQGGMQRTPRRRGRRR